jgi:hypothetical protein
LQIREPLSIRTLPITQRLSIEPPNDPGSRRADGVGTAPSSGYRYGLGASGFGAGVAGGGVVGAVLAGGGGGGGGSFFSSLHPARAKTPISGNR